jgi:hypothetical protein
MIEEVRERFVGVTERLDKIFTAGPFFMALPPTAVRYD